MTIASVLVQDPELIILDEPTGGQDFRHYTDIMEFLRGLNAKGVTVVMITHDMHLMLEYTPERWPSATAADCGSQRGGHPLRPSADRAGGTERNQPFTLANRCGITPAGNFVERFIAADREVRADGC